jgi:hypothetical protein
LTYVFGLGSDVRLNKREGRTLALFAGAYELRYRRISEMYGNKLIGSIPPEISKLTALTVL